MDSNLQEFTDPALYDAENLWDAPDNFYLELAKQVGGPVLDIGCGTGRLTRAIASAGLHVTGMDIMHPMLERARALSPHLPVTWVQADCRTFDLAQRFQCALMTGHAFQNLLTDAEQRAFLERSYNHIDVGGTLAFETRNLRGKNYGSSGDYRLWKSFQDSTGRLIEVWVASRFDSQTMIDHVQLMRKVRGTNEMWPSQIALRYIGVEELNQRLVEHGFTIVAQYGDWAKTPFSPASPEIISVCRR
ncbi:MAG: class I SAM-dependent methyltransferase [Acidobacteria bacterium]|nr:class I SAM-dependent methyltransferase [Acidobacteriota bacterium]